MPDRCPGSLLPPNPECFRGDPYGLCRRCRRAYALNRFGNVRRHKGLPKRADGGCPYRCEPECDFACYFPQEVRQ
ncbi:hypothetical protein [Mycobacterium heckeshornense]|uniref:hypothetical protein n=1 Tax=Mycobacterium heckeshornense TaxID=110505 RepID=UPI001364CCE1|nr:hypothetical protein [Mycobacterium heckeshornense]